MAYRRGRSTRRTSGYRTRRPVARRRRTSRRRGVSTKRIVIQVVGASPGVLASPVTLGSKTLRPLRRKY